MLQVLVGGIIGFIAAVFAEPVRQHFWRPKLTVAFNDGEEYQSSTPDKREYVGDSGTKFSVTHKAIYLRMKVENKKQTIAKNCRAYLVNVEKRNEETENNIFEKTVYSDCIPLAWSCRQSPDLKGSEFKPIDIPNGVSQFVDLLYTLEVNDIDFVPKEISTHYNPTLAVMPYRYEKLFQEQGTFRFTIQISGDNTSPVLHRIIFEWHGEWDKFRAYDDHSI